MTFTAFEDFTEQLDEVYNERTRTKTFNGRKYTIRCTDPYGAWVIEPKGGVVPEMFRQQFTTMDDAWKVIQSYEQLHKDKLDKQTEKKTKYKKEIEI